MNDREELVRLIAFGADSYGTDFDDLRDEREIAADAILHAGFRKVQSSTNPTEPTDAEVEAAIRAGFEFANENNLDWFAAPNAMRAALKAATAHRTQEGQQMTEDLGDWSADATDHIDPPTRWERVQLFFQIDRFHNLVRYFQGNLK